MQACHRKPACFFSLLVGLLFCIGSHASFADDIIITGNQIIDRPMEYSNVVLDMTNGRFTIKPGGSLTIQNSTINTKISASNPFAIWLVKGKLSLKKNVVNVMSSGVTPNSNVKAAYPLIEVQEGDVSINGNTFTDDTAFTVSFLETQNLATNDVSIVNNFIKNFHGGVYLVNSDSATINDNTFENVSFSNVFYSGNTSKIKRNLFSFPGNLVSGNAMDIVNASGVNIVDNIISSGSNYGIYINGGQNLFIDNNKISDGASYAIFIDTPKLAATKDKYLSQLLPKHLTNLTSNYNIQITNNYLAQNRYGLISGKMDSLTVINNIFIQRFIDNSTRKYWTNNEILLPLVTNLTWVDNLYKEAFTQEVPGDNTNTLQFVPFPKSGGVFLP